MNFRETSLISWIKTFPALEEPLRNVEIIPHLATGIVILQLAEEVILFKDPSESEISLLEGASSREYWEIAFRMLGSSAPWLFETGKGSFCTEQEEALNASVVVAAADCGEVGTRARVMLCRILEALLGCAVAVECPKRDVYIKRIMALEESQQQFLVEIIEEQFERRRVYFGSSDDEETGSFTGSPLRVETDNDDEIENSKNQDQQNNNVLSKEQPDGSKKIEHASLEKSKSSSNLCSGTENQRNDQNHSKGNEALLSLQQDLQMSKEELEANKRLVGELQAKFKTLEEKYTAVSDSEERLRTELTELSGRHSSLSLSCQSRLLQQEDDLRSSFEEQRRQLELELTKTSQLAESRFLVISQLKAEIAGLHDETDVLRPLAQRAEAAEVSLEKCRAKLEDSKDLRDLLKREEEAHAKVIERLLDAEREATAVGGLRRQLEASKRKCTEVEMQALTAEASLAEMAHEIGILRKERDDLAAASEVYQKERQCLLDEVEKLAARKEEEGEQEVVGKGISEFNPLLSEELGRLRQENISLKEMLSQTTTDRFETLEIDLDDTKRLTEALKEKLADTTAKLEISESELIKATLMNQKLEDEIKRKEKESSVLQSTLAEKISCLENRTALSQEELEARTQIHQLRLFHKDLQTEAFSWLNHQSTKAKNIMWGKVMEESKATLAIECRKHMEQREGRLASDITIQTLRLQMDQEREQRRKDMEELELKHDISVRKMMEDSQEVLSSVKAAADERVLIADEQVAQVKSNAEEKYKNMLNDLKLELESYKQKFSVSNDDHTRSHDETARQLAATKAKLLTYQSKVAELKEAQRHLEREKTFLRSESDRFRHLASASRNGVGESELLATSLQKEFDKLLEENRSLKAKYALVPSGNAVTGQGLGSIEEVVNEYENKLQKMNEERRELVRGKSAAVMAHQSLQREVMQKEEKLRKLKEQNRTLEVNYERVRQQLHEMKKQCELNPALEKENVSLPHPNVMDEHFNLEIQNNEKIFLEQANPVKFVEIDEKAGKIGITADANCTIQDVSQELQDEDQFSEPPSAECKQS